MKIEYAKGIANTKNNTSIETRVYCRMAINSQTPGFQARNKYYSTYMNIVFNPHQIAASRARSTPNAATVNPPATTSTPPAPLSAKPDAIVQKIIPF